MGSAFLCAALGTPRPSAMPTISPHGSTCYAATIARLSAPPATPASRRLAARPHHPSRPIPSGRSPSGHPPSRGKYSGMSPLTPALRAQLRANAIARQAAEQSGTPRPDPAPIVKFFNPVGAAIWLATELHDDGDTLFGLADLGLGYPELGLFSLSENCQRPPALRSGDRARHRFCERPAAVGLGRCREPHRVDPHRRNPASPPSGQNVHIWPDNGTPIWAICEHRTTSKPGKTGKRQDLW